MEAFFGSLKLPEWSDVADLAWSTWDYAVQGGWVMIPMIIGSIAMWALILERMRTYARLAGEDVDASVALAAVAEPRSPNALQLPAEAQGLRRRVLERFLTIRTGRPNLDRAVLRHISERQRRQLRGRLAVIAALAGVAPLLGLLGTVLGMIETFQVISVFGTSNARAMATGISVALITTETGLLIAIPGLFISGALIRKSKRLESALDEFTLALDRSLHDGARQNAGLEAVS
jgi:biopolymer transport protein ExbB